MDRHRIQNHPGETHNLYHQVYQELLEHKKRLRKVNSKLSSNDFKHSLIVDPAGADLSKTYESGLDKVNAGNSLYDLLREQSENIKKMTTELDQAKQAIVVQKTINRAKLLLMQQLNYDEAQAHRVLQKQAMDQKVNLAKMAELVVKASHGQ